MDPDQREEACRRLYRRPNRSPGTPHGPRWRDHQWRPRHRQRQILRDGRRRHPHRRNSRGPRLDPRRRLEVVALLCRSGLQPALKWPARWRQYKEVEPRKPAQLNPSEENFVAMERTFAIIKPDAVSRGQQGEILVRIHKAGFKIVAIKSMRLTKEEAGGFYAVHRERPFFN